MLSHFTVGSILLKYENACFSKCVLPHVTEFTQIIKVILCHSEFSMHYLLK